LSQGSAYCDIYTGGAAESHFCASNAGWGGVLSSLDSLALAGLLLGHAWSFVRIAALMVVEFGLAVVDCLLGLISGRNLRKELLMVPARIIVCILMRELIYIGISLDISRGLPIIHANFLGYDEQAHRRGPSSAFAHWTLKGIDFTLARIWHVARRSQRRDYDVWIYSDHGQQESMPYERAYERTIEQAIADVLTSVQNESPPEKTEVGPSKNRDRIRGNSARRATWLSASRFVGWLSGLPRDQDIQQVDGTVVTAMGPVGHIYLVDPRTHDPAWRDRLARSLVKDAHIPLVMTRVADGSIRAFTPEGCFDLKGHAERILGRDHPFLEEVTEDLEALCMHPDSGLFVICGWTPVGMPLTFPHEHGAHAGPGPDETRAFALLPVDAPLASSTGRPYLRPMDLREAALRELGRRPLSPERARLPAVVSTATNSRSLVSSRPAAESNFLRIMTYNVHYCVGMDRKISVERVARVIRTYRPDVVAIQELDIAKHRSGRIDQVCEIARLLEMDCHFHPAWQIEEEMQGDAVLSRYPMRLVRSAALPSDPKRMALRPRGALWVELEFAETKIQLINTHLDVLPAQQRFQAESLLGPDWLSHPDCRLPIILCGDFNFGPRSRIFERLASRLRDVQKELDGHRPHPTWRAGTVRRRIDHIFLSDNLKPIRIHVPRTELARSASDHLPLIADISVVSTELSSRVSLQAKKLQD
jgi:endonuclease/exonuclease/phosphatase family metal-dependent hydrolase